MISKKVIELMNKQIQMEEDSSRIYLAMAAWAERNAFRGTASFMFRQSEEERKHMQKFIRFLLDVGEQPVLGNLEAPVTTFKGIDEIFELSLAHEKKVTAAINGIFTVARENNDYAATSFLKWFVDEQVEEEATAQQALDIIRMAGKVSLYLADKEIGGLNKE